MQIPQISWGFFALIHDDTGRLLIKQRTDGKWDLPGGGMDPHETSPIQTLVREVKEEVGLDVTEVVGPVGSPLPFYIEAKGKTDIAQAYLCKVMGTPQCTDEAVAFDWFDLDTVIRWLKEPSEGKSFVGPADRVGRTPRMILDGLAILNHHDKIAEYPLIQFPGYITSSYGCYLESGHGYASWRRLDPFTSSGYVEIS